MGFKSKHEQENIVLSFFAVFRAETWVLLLGGYVATMSDK